MILTKDQIQQAARAFFSGKPVRKAWLFGSYARNEADEDSDVDVLVDIDEEAKIGLRYLTWHEEMEKVVRKKVQIVSDGAVSDYLRPFIETDKLLLYER